MKKKFVKTLVAIVAACCLMTAFAFAGCFVDGGNDGKKPEETKYTVIYSAGEGKGVSPQAGQYAEGATFKLPEPTGLSKDKFIFDKWNDGTADYAVGATYTMPAHDVTFTAMWKSNGEITTYTVTYSAGEGAIGTAPEGGEYEEGETFELPESTGLSKEEYTFDKWNDGEADYAAGATYTMPDHDVTFTAKWKANEVPQPATKYTVTFDPSNEEEPWTEQIEEGKPVSKPETDPVYPGQKYFMYWTIDGVEYDFSKPVTSDIELTAKYGYKVTFLAGEGATGTVEPIIASLSSRVELPDGTGLSNGDKIFDGWTDGIYDYKAGDSYVVRSNTTFTAIWKDAQPDQPDPPVTGQKYTITFVKSTIASQIASVEGTLPTMEDKAAGEKFTLPECTLTNNAHYHFTNWRIQRYVVENGEGSWQNIEDKCNYDVGEEFTMPDYNIQIGAVWVQDVVTINFDANGGSGEMASITQSFGTSMALTAKKFDCKFTAPVGKEFAYWSLSENGAELANGTKLDDSIVTNNTVTLYAIWKTSAAPTTPVNSLNEIAGKWTGDAHSLYIVTAEEEYVIGYGILNGEQFLQFIESEGAIYALNLGQDDLYTVTKSDNTLTLTSDAYKTYTFNSKTAINNTAATEFNGMWAKQLANGSQPWYITENVAYYGLSLTHAQTMIIGEYLVLKYEIAGSEYVYVLSKDGETLKGKYEAPEFALQDVTFTKGGYYMLTVDGTPNQVVVAGKAPDADKIKKPEAPEGQAFSKWVIAGTDTEFDPTAVLTADTAIEAKFSESASSTVLTFVGSATVNNNTIVTKIIIDTETNKVTFEYTYNGAAKTMEATATVENGNYKIMGSENPSGSWMWLVISEDGQSLQCHDDFHGPDEKLGSPLTRA